LGEARILEGAPVYAIRDREKLYDVLLEVIDPTTKQLLASQRFDATFDLLIDDEQVSSSRVLKDGAYRIDIWRVQLQQGRIQ
jgi:hypothetical protein